jgi:hypothetical protein
MILTHTCSRCKKDYNADSVPGEHDICPDCWIGDSPEFQDFRKIPRFSREITITEKIDGTNGVICITDSGLIFAGSRTRWLWNSTQAEIHNDNQGFARWVKENREELMKLGPGFHYGEWWGSGIQRAYAMRNGEKRFSLFNTNRWIDPIALKMRGEYHEQYLSEQKLINKNLEFCPECCFVVPVLYRGPLEENAIYFALEQLKREGSVAMPGFMDPEGIVIYHSAARMYFKKTIENDEKGKEQ